MIENSPDMIEQGQTANERELALQRLERNLRRDRDARTALQRIEQGTYGSCLRCDAEIGVKRLAAVPWTSYCLLCQELADHQQKQIPAQDLIRASSYGEVDGV